MFIIRYNCCQSLRLWYRNPSNRNRLHVSGVVEISNTHINPYYNSGGLCGIFAADFSLVCTGIDEPFGYGVL